MTYLQIRSNEEIRTYIKAADESLCALGYTEHSLAHVTCVAERAGEILERLSYDARTVELAKIAGYPHDIGNLINRIDHSQSGAVMAFRLLDKLGFPPMEIAPIVTAIGNHDEGTGVPVSPIAAALILADKTDVRRSRVRNADLSAFDIHDRVNYSVVSSDFAVNASDATLTLTLNIDTAISSVMSYFEIFLERMLLCRRAAERLGTEFHLFINDQRLL